MDTLKKRKTFEVTPKSFLSCFWGLHQFHHVFLCIAMLFICQTSFAQTKLNVTGLVKDAIGEPIIGASVVEKGTKNGVITDIDGKFAITVSSGSTLSISFIGYKTQQVVVPSNGKVIVTLKEDSDIIDEVVVVGYGVQKKANLTGSVASVDFKKLENIPAANATSLLQGRLPGVVLTSNGGQAGNDTPEIRVRGIGTLSGNNDPMVLIDGVEGNVSQISQIAASDIDNVSVLKDAASASIYGVRAANGVILITTKKGFESRPKISYTGSISIQSPTKLPDFVNSYEWAKMYNECHTGNVYTEDMLQKLQDGSDPDHFANTDWADAMFHSAIMQQHSLSATGGTKDVHYMISLGYLNQDGILKTTGYERFNFRSNIDAKVGIFKLGLNLSGSKDNVSEPNASITGDGLMRTLTWYTRPTVPVQYSNGYWGCVDGSSISQSVFKNPLQMMNEGYKKNNNYHFDGQAYVEVDILSGLKFRSSLAYKMYMNDKTTFNPKFVAKYDAEGNQLTQFGTNNVSDYHYLQNSYTNENILTYMTSIDKHKINVLLGHSIMEWRYDTTNAYKENLATDNLYELDAATANAAASGNAQEYSLQSFFGRLNYNYDDKYLFEMNIRHDGSSRMPKAHRYATFPSFSAAWIVTNESFMQNIEPLTSLKLRASWGKLGNQEIGNYPYTATMGSSYNYYFGNDKQIGMAENIVANDNIKWETTTITDLGFDASLWKGKINVTFDYFNKITSDILLQLSMPSTFLGSLGAPYQNAGKVRNRGWELAANYYDHSGDFTWNAGFSLSGVQNKILDNKGIDQINGQSINREGYAIGSYYGLKAIGIYRTQEDLNRTNSKGDVIKQNGIVPSLGDIMYEDTNDNGNVTSDDRQILGNPFPKLSYSFNLGITWKNFDLNTFWQGVSGVYRYSWEQTTISNGGNMTTRWIDRWSQTNTNSSMPRLGNTNNDEYSSFWLEKSDYLRLKNLEFGYTFDKSLVRKIGIDNIRLFFTATNLITFTSLDNYDPEKSSGDMRNDTYPNVKSFSFGLNVKF